MGSAMATSLTRGGASVILWNRTLERIHPLAEEIGARIASSAADAASQAEVAITMLADGPAVEAVWAGQDGLVSGAHPGVVLVDMSTVPPSVIKGLAPATRARGAGILDAPVSGSVHLAASGQLTIMAGGDEADLERARPAFDLLATRIFHLGELGTGAAMKLAVNAIIFGLNGAISEALVLAERAGVDRALAYDVIAAGAAGAPFVGYKRASFVDPENTPVAFSLDLTEKDLRLITEFAAELGVPVPQAERNLDVAREAAAGGNGGRDLSSVASYLRDASAVGAGSGGSSGEEPD
jgi:3-hydroxyisobutyrate dehydrogenase/2-hydroxy-3-oxopropionate reductase